MGGYSTDFHLVTAGDFGDDIEAMIRNAGQPALAPLGAAAGALPTAAWSAREAQPLSDDLFSYFLDESSQDSQKSESTFHVAPSASSVGTTAPAWSGVITFPETMRTTPLPHGALAHVERDAKPAPKAKARPASKAKAPPLPPKSEPPSTPELGFRKWGTGKQRLALAKPWPVPGNPEAARAARARRRAILDGKRRAARAALVSHARVSSTPKPYAYRALIASTRQRVGGRFVKQTTLDGKVAIPADEFYVKREAEDEAAWPLPPMPVL